MLVAKLNCAVLLMQEGWLRCVSKVHVIAGLTNVLIRCMDIVHASACEKNGRHPEKHKPTILLSNVFQILQGVSPVLVMHRPDLSGSLWIGETRIGG
jgi:hypothetical protein